MLISNKPHSCNPTIVSVKYFFSSSLINMEIRTNIRRKLSQLSKICAIRSPPRGDACDLCVKHRHSLQHLPATFYYKHFYIYVRRLGGGKINVQIFFYNPNLIVEINPPDGVIVGYGSIVLEPSFNFFIAGDQGANGCPDRNWIMLPMGAFVALPLFEYSSVLLSIRIESGRLFAPLWYWYYKYTVLVLYSKAFCVAFMTKKLHRFQWRLVWRYFGSWKKILATLNCDKRCTRGWSRGQDLVFK